MNLAPAEKLAVAVLCNTENDLPARVRDEILAALLPAYGEALGESRKQKEEGSTERPVCEPAPQLLGVWATDAQRAEPLDDADASVTNR